MPRRKSHRDGVFLQLDTLRDQILTLGEHRLSVPASLAGKTFQVYFFEWVRQRRFEGIGWKFRTTVDNGNPISLIVRSSQPTGVAILKGETLQSEHKVPLAFQATDEGNRLETWAFACLESGVPLEDVLQVEGGVPAVSPDSPAGKAILASARGG